MARVGHNAKNLDESDLLLPSATPTEQSTDDIKLSLNRIEELLNRGHQLLYGDEVGISSELGESKDGLGYVPAGDEPHGLTQHDVAGISSSTKSSHVQAREMTAEGLDAELSPLTPVSTSTPTAFVTPVKPQKKSYTPPARNRPRSRSGSLHQKSGTSEAKMEKEMLSMSASARGARLGEIKKKTGKVLALEEGVDENDKPQNVSIETLKERIHRELEEYRRNGPLMPGSKSAKRPRKNTLSSTVPAKTAQSAPPRSRFGFAATTSTAPREVAARPAPRTESRALTTTAASTTAGQPRQAAIRPRANVPSSGYGKTRATTADAAAARPGRPARSSAAGPTGATTSSPAPRTRAVRGNTTAGAAASAPPARRQASKPSGTTTHGHERAVGTRPNKSELATRHTRAGEDTSEAPQRVPVWERLYSHAAEQDSALKRRREQQRQEARAMANTTTAKSQPRATNHYHVLDSRPIPRQEREVAQQPFRPLTMGGTHDSDVKNTSISTLRLSSNPRHSRSASMQRRSSGTTNVVPLMRPSDDASAAPHAGQSATRHTTTAQSMPEQSPMGRPEPVAESVSPVPAPPPQSHPPKPSQVNNKNNISTKETHTVPNPAKKLQLDRPEEEEQPNMCLLDVEDDEADTSPQQVPNFVRPLDLRGIKK